MLSNLKRTILDIPFYIMKLDPSLEGMDFNAVVDIPAHMKSYETFAKKKKVVRIKDHFNEEKRIVTGVAIAVDLPMYRDDEQLGPHYVYFKADDTEEIWIQMMAKNYLHNVNNMHDEEEELEGMIMFEAYRVNKEGGIYPLMFKDQNLKDGSIIVSYKAETDEAWAAVKANTGFSIEGWFKKVPIKMKGQFKANGKIAFCQVPVKKDKHGAVIQEVDVWDITLVEDTIELGTELHYSWLEDGVEMDGGRIRDGEYISDGRTVQVDSRGIVVMIDGKTAEQLKKIKSKNRKMNKPSFFKRIFGKSHFGSATTVDGIEISWEGELAEGVEIMMKDEAGDDVLVPEGDHTIINDDGSSTVITVDGNGIATAITTVDAPDMDEEMEKVIKKIIADNKVALKKLGDSVAEKLNAQKEELTKDFNEKITASDDKIKTLCQELDKFMDSEEFKEKFAGSGGGTEREKSGWEKFVFAEKD